MIEVFGKDGRAFRFQDGTPDDIIQSALDKHYGIEPSTENPELVALTLETIASTPLSAPIEPPSQEPIIPVAPQYVPQPNAQHHQPSSQQMLNNEPVLSQLPQDKAMQITMMVGAAAVGVLAVTAILWATGMIGKRPQTESASAVTATASSYQATPQPDMRAAQVATQIRKDSKSDSPVLKELAAGATVDVLGEQTIANVNWLRVRADQTTGAVGYVIASHLGAIGTAAPVVTLVPSTGSPTTPNGAAVGLAVPPAGRTPGVVAPAQSAAAMPSTTYYVVSRQLNVRVSASPDAARVGRLDFGTPLLADAQANYQGRVWLRVRANNGVSGWINSNLVSLTPANAPVDEVAYAAPPPGRYVAPAYNFSGYSRGDAVRVTAINANVRVEPSARGGTDTVIDVAPIGEAFNVERVYNANGKTWYRVTTSKGITGWISAETVRPAF